MDNRPDDERRPTGASEGKERPGLDGGGRRGAASDSAAGSAAGSASGSASGSAAGAEGTPLPRDAATFLQTLAQALQKHTMYPPGHPALGPAVQEALAALEDVLSERSVLSVGIASRQLAVEGAESDPEHTRLSFLAGRLHRHQLASVTFSAGIQLEELAEFLAAVAPEAERCDRPLGAAPPAELPSWPHLRIQPIRYEKLGLAAGSERSREENRSGKLWLGLARAALVSDAVEVDTPRDAAATLGAENGAGEGSGDPASGADGTGAEAADGADRPAPALEEEGETEALARAVEEFSSEAAYAEEVLGHLVNISRELRSAQGEQAQALRRRTSRLVSLVKPDALRRVLREGGDGAERRQLLLDAAQWMEPDSVVKLVQATAGVERQDISHWLLLMMSKLAQHASVGEGRIQAEAESTLRDQVAQLVTDWALEDAVPTEYGSALERMSQSIATPVGASSHETVSVEPERLLMIGLEVDQPGGAVWSAVATMVESKRFAALLELIDAAPEGSRAAEALWNELASPESVRRVLEMDEPDFEALDLLVQRAGTRAAAPMLEVLIESESRSVRRQLFSRVAAMGSEVAPLVVRHLDDGRWFVKRNMLALMGEYDAWPRKWSPATHADDAHPAVRREALKLMLRVPELRDMAVRSLLEDPDPRSIALGLGAAQEAAPREAIPLLVGLAEDPKLRPELRVMAVRALGGVRQPEAIRVLLRIVRDEGGWLSRLFGRWKLAEPSPAVLEALAVLRRTWSEDGRARRVLDRAARSDEAEVREAASGKRVSVATADVSSDMSDGDEEEGADERRPASRRPGGNRQDLMDGEAAP